MSTTARLVVPHHAASAATARRRITSDASRHRLPAPVIDDIALMISELVGNSVRHADPLPGDVIEVCWEIQTDQVLLRVTDGGSRSYPHRRTVDSRSTAGRGLAIVEMLARDWGVDVVARGTSVWASVSYDPARHPALSGRC